MAFDPDKMAVGRGRELPADWNALTSRIIGCAIEVHRALGPGLREKIYEHALVIELRRAGFQVGQQRPFRVRYRDEDIGVQVMDLVVNDLVIIDTKAVAATTEDDEAQILGYLRFTGLPIGVIINFNKAKLTDGITRKINWPAERLNPEIVVDLPPLSVPSVSSL